MKTAKQLNELATSVLNQIQEQENAKAIDYLETVLAPKLEETAKLGKYCLNVIDFCRDLKSAQKTFIVQYLQKSGYGVKRVDNTETILICW